MQANKQRTNQNSPFKGYLMKGIAQIMQLNIKGFSKSKAEVLERIAMEQKIDILVVQETHTADQKQLLKRGHITGFKIAGATFHSKYGTATYIRIKSNLKWNHIRTSEEKSI
jgi:exonuclease III